MEPDQVITRNVFLISEGDESFLFYEEHNGDRITPLLALGDQLYELEAYECERLRDLLLDRFPLPQRPE